MRGCRTTRLIVAGDHIGSVTIRCRFYSFRYTAMAQDLVSEARAREPAFYTNSRFCPDASALGSLHAFADDNNHGTGVALSLIHI